jgi:F0F1-type ATP synthase epsilon subunit
MRFWIGGDGTIQQDVARSGVGINVVTASGIFKIDQERARKSKKEQERARKSKKEQ